MPVWDKALVVEDSPMMQSLYRMVMEDAARALVFADDGVQGLDRAAQEATIDLYIVDINLPRMDGIEFIRRLRAELRSDAPVVVVSTECTEPDKAAAYEAGADAYLCKPWRPEELTSILDGLRRPEKT